MVLASKDGSSGFDIKPQKLSPSSIACNGVLADESGCTKARACGAQVRHDFATLSKLKRNCDNSGEYWFSEFAETSVPLTSLGQADGLCPQKCGVSRLPKHSQRLRSCRLAAVYVVNHYVDCCCHQCKQTGHSCEPFFCPMARGCFHSPREQWMTFAVNMPNRSDECCKNACCISPQHEPAPTTQM